MKPVIIARGGPVLFHDPHPDARVTEPPLVLPDDQAVKLACERLLNPQERRRFRALFREAHDRNREGVHTSIRLALARMHDEVTERIRRAQKTATG